MEMTMAKKRGPPRKVTGTRRPSARRPKLHDQTIELRDEIERRTAFAVGLPPGLLTKEEKRFLPKEFDVDVYLSVQQTGLRIPWHLWQCSLSFRFGTMY